MDPLWSETFWSTFKYFIILIVFTCCILCVSWIIKCLIIIEARRKHEDCNDSVLLLHDCCRSVMVQQNSLRLASEPDRSSWHPGQSSQCCTAVQPHKRVPGGFIFSSNQSDNRRFRSTILLVSCPPGVSVICLVCKANTKHRPPSPFTKDLIQRDFLKNVFKLRTAPVPGDMDPARDGLR